MWGYTTIPRVREILLIRSTRIGAELLRRQPDSSWPAEPEMLSGEAELRLAALDFSCPLTALYDGTHLVG